MQYSVITKDCIESPKYNLQYHLPGAPSIGDDAYSPCFHGEVWDDDFDDLDEFKAAVELAVSRGEVDQIVLDMVEAMDE